MSSKVYNKEYIKGIELLKRKWNVGDEIVYNSDPEDIGNEYLHLNYGTINNIFINQTKKQMIYIHLPYGKITIPLEKITLQFIPKKDNECEANQFDATKNNIDWKEVKRFFVYGTLRDDIKAKSVHIKDWLMNGSKIAETGRLYKFKLYKERYEDLPFAVRTNDSKDYITGRIISWHEDALFQNKLHFADIIGGYPLYIRNIVDVLNESGDLITAIAYYQDINTAVLDPFYEIPDGDWLKRDKSRDLSEYNPPSAEMLVMLQQMMRTCNQNNDELIDSLPLPPEELESSSDDGDIQLQASEYFRISGDNIAIVNDCKTVKKFRKEIHSAYGKYMVRSNNNNNIYKWRFKIKYHAKKSKRVLVIGISAKFMLHLNDSFYANEEFENYAYDLCNGHKVSQNLFEPYAIRTKSNDIIDMELNMRQCSLRYYVNGKYLGIAFEDLTKDKSVAYQLAVSLEQHQDEITLLNFRIIHQP